MKTFRASMVLPLFGLLASLAACSGQSPSAEGTGAASSSLTTATQSESVPVPDHDGHDGKRMGHGPASLIFAALHAPINLTTEQRTTIESLVDSLKSQAPKPSQAFEAHKAALANAIRKNEVKVEALAFKPEVFEHAEKDAALAKALTTLHDTLTPEQRTQLVAAVEKRMEGKGKGDHDHDGPKGKLEGKHHDGFGPMHLLEGLDLTKEQKDAIHTQLAANEPAPPTEEQKATMKAQHEAMKKEMAARLQTFVGDEFDATAFLAKPTNAPEKGKMGFGHGDRMLKDLAVIVPILTPAQRELLAAKIEKGPMGPAMNGK
jgi:Spy/CpxP family protein refolding chaperone